MKKLLIAIEKFSTIELYPALNRVIRIMDSNGDFGLHLLIKLNIY